MRERPYSLLMVDDEELIRNGFRKRIPWAELGFEFWEPCADGREALRVLETRRPDVLLTDINMPHVDGLELCRTVNHLYPDVLLVVLSGFDDFEYARTAMRYRVWDYVLKPMNVEDLRALLGRLKAELGQRHSAARVGSEALGLHLLRGSVPEVLHAEAARVLGAGWEQQAWCCAHLETTWEGDPATLETDPEAPVAVGLEPLPHGEARRWKLLYAAREPALAHKRAFFGCRRLVGELRQRSQWVVGAVSAPGPLASLPSAAREVDDAALLRFVREDDVYQLPAASEPASGLGEFPASFRRALDTGTPAEQAELVQRFAAALKACVPARRLAEDLQAVFTAVAERHPSPEDVDELRAVALARDAADLVRRLETLCRTVKLRLDLEGSPVADQKIREFQGLLARRYADAQLGIEDVSRELNLSPSYLTKLLRKKLGRSFLDCLTEVRMDAARQLLASTNLMTYEVAEKTGFADARYFSSSFKKNVGQTPSGFRAQRRDNA